MTGDTENMTGVGKYGRTSLAKSNWFKCYKKKQ